MLLGRGGRGGREEVREEQRWLGFAVTTYSLAETRVLKETNFGYFYQPGFWMFRLAGNPEGPTMGSPELSLNRFFKESALLGQWPSHSERQ